MPDGGCFGMSGTDSKSSGSHALTLLPRLRTLLKHAPNILMVLCMVLAASEAVRQHRETESIRALASRVVTAAHATNRREQVIALRDYIRANVTYVGAPASDDERPFLRATALETMESGLGYCGEDSRAFINLADAVGIPAARVNLYGSNPHVVALADLGPSEQVVVDAQNPPHIADLETLDHAMVTHGYDDFSTLNLRRLHLGWLFSRVKLTIGPITYWGENPHAIKALLWSLLALAILTPRWGRALLRHLLLRRGWIHVSSLKRVREPQVGVPE